MARDGIFLVLASPSSTTPAGIEAFHKWYNEHHAPDVLNMPGWLSARRFKMADEQLIPLRPIEPSFDFVAIYEIDDVAVIPDSRVLMGKLAKAYPDFFSPTIDSANLRAFVMEQISEITEPNPLPAGVEL